MPRGSNPDLETFLNLIFPWGGDYDQLWKAVAWTFPKDPGKPDLGGAMANYAAQGFDQLMRLIETRVPRQEANVYVALGTFKLVQWEKTTSDGYPKAVRQIRNVVSHNSVYLDIDVGKANAYATTQDAFAALDDFLEVSGLPDATMEIQSGSGGLHIYWCTTEPMEPGLWIPLATALRDAAKAYGLRFDPQCTVNPAGVLRVPNSLNHKHNPPSRVMLMQDSSFQRYTYKQLADALAGYIKNVPPIQAGPRLVPSAGKVAQNFQAGVSEAAPVSLDALAQGCPLFADVLDRNGDGDPEPLWNLILMAATFTTDPVDAAHQLSLGDSRYVPAETDRKLQEKINARAQNPAIGWPKCASFDAYSTICATCPHRGEGKSPLHFAPKPSVAHPPNQPGQIDWLPSGYELDWNSHIFTNVWVGKGENRVPARIDVLRAPVYEAGIDPTDDKNSLVFKSHVAGKDRYIEILVGTNLQPTGCAQQFAKQGIYIDPKFYAEGRDFTVAWVDHLQQQRKLIRQVPYGWTPDGEGFTFDRTTYHSDGSAQLCHRGSSWDERFAQKGQLKPWQDAMALVYGNPALEAATATAFAAPLVALISNTSLVMSLYSHLSGVGKTTSMTLAQAVWGHPREGMSALADTENSVIKKISDLRALPVYWDELRTADDMERITKLVFQITQGKTKARLTSDIKQQPTSSFTTLFMVASNYGIVDSVYQGTDGTEAGALRVYEIECGPLTATMNQSQSQQRLISLNQNYGVAGALYSDFIARNRAGIVKIVQHVQDDLMARFQFAVKERFWLQTVTALKVGAMLANRAGLTSYDLATLDTFLVDTLMRQRNGLRENVHLTLEDSTSGDQLLNELFAELKAKNSIIFTDIIAPTRAGRPPAVSMLAGQDPTKLGDVWCQVASNRSIRVKAKQFDQWCVKRRIMPKRAKQLLVRSGYMVVTGNRLQIGTGVQFLESISHAGGTRVLVYDFVWQPSGPGSILGSSLPN